MELTLFILFLLFSLILIAFGLFFREHTELSIVGFLLLFFVGLILLNNSLVYKIGQDKNITTINANLTTETSRDVYTVYEDSQGFLTSHRLGYFIVMVALIGFIGSMYGLKKSRKD